MNFGKFLAFEFPATNFVSEQACLAFFTEPVKQTKQTQWCWLKSKEMAKCDQKYLKMDLV